MSALFRCTARTALRSIKTSPPFTQFTRAMSASLAGKSEWLVLIPDHEGVLKKRMEVRPLHFAALSQKEYFSMGGGLLEDPPKEGEPLKLNGSAVMTYAASREEVMEQLKDDIYVTSGVWDLSKVQIYPFKCAFRKELSVRQ